MGRRAGSGEPSIGSRRTTMAPWPLLRNSVETGMVRVFEPSAKLS